MTPAHKLVRVERQRSIRAPQQRVYQLLSRVEGHPRFADLWLAADVLEHGGGQVVAEFRGYFAGLPVDSVQRLSLRPPARLEFRQVRGTLKALRGEYVIERDGQGARLTARMEVEAGIPLLEEETMRMVLTTALDRMVGKVKDAAERDLPRLVARKPGALAAAVPAAFALPGSGKNEESGEGEVLESSPGVPEPPEPEPAATAALPAQEGSAPRREGPPAGAAGRSGRRRRRHRRGRRSRQGGTSGPGGSA